MGFSLHGRMYHSSRGSALIVRGSAILGQSRHCLGSCNTFTLLPLSAAQMRAIIFHVSFSTDVQLETYNNVEIIFCDCDCVIIGSPGSPSLTVTSNFWCILMIRLYNVPCYNMLHGGGPGEISKGQ